MKVDDSVNVVTVDGDGGDTINGATTQLLTSQFHMGTVMWDGTEWKITAESDPTLISINSIITTQGDIIVGDALGVAVGLVLGGNTHVFQSDGTDAFWDIFPLSFLTEELTPDETADFVMTYDDAAGDIRKVLLSNLPSSAVFAEYIELNLGSFANSTAYSDLHTLTGQPKGFQGVLRCTNAESGYSIGDDVIVDSFSHQADNARMISFWTSATEIGAAFPVETLGRLKDASNRFTMTPGSWDVIMRAWR